MTARWLVPARDNEYAWPGVPYSARTFDLPPSARDWLRPGERAWLWLPSDPLSPRDEQAARDQLAAWDALAGRLLREALFGEGEPRRLMKDAEAVAAVAEQLAVRMGQRQ